MKSNNGLKAVFWILVLGCCWPGISAPMALVAGIAFGILVGNPWGSVTSTWSRRLLQASVIGLGFGMNLPELLKTGKDAFLYTAISIGFTMAAGYLLGKLFRTPQRTSTLISFGTAICGGSAIAAMAPVIKAEAEETGVALATVFTLNSIALVLFPPVGHLLGMGQRQFGLWSALAIHDTSSVVGAAAAYGGLALAIGTTVKLTRALWIMPSALLAAWFTKSGGKVQFPLFIIGFIAAATITTALPQLDHVWHPLNNIAKQSLVVTLFLIGSGLTREVLGGTGIRPLAQGVALWILVSVTSGTAIMCGWLD
ncbi:putative sulfate exporter family transporter [Oryzomonas sagensis]|uniref:Sulfate exporter family transporter n=1 Tax=Oryzomonas sagensis TaxID=2603857 RepID=A0ABQ6TL25_9BACT|nr:putative sulfate exporter family transporter [Oryzomonas sagensis]KAB0668810.1 putative sulfate exporter family transporter [Oryzomonas sagensis]